MENDDVPMCTVIRDVVFLAIQSMIMPAYASECGTCAHGGSFDFMLR